MTNLPGRNDGVQRVDHLNQSGHSYLAETGHFYLAVTCLLRIMYIMLNDNKVIGASNRRILMNADARDPVRPTAVHLSTPRGIRQPPFV